MNSLQHIAATHSSLLESIKQEKKKMKEIVKALQKNIKSKIEFMEMNERTLMRNMEQYKITEVPIDGWMYYLDNVEEKTINKKPRVITKQREHAIEEVLESNLINNADDIVRDIKSVIDGSDDEEEPKLINKIKRKKMK